MPHAARNRAPPITARSTFGWPSVTDRWCPDISAWPRKNDPNDATRPVTSETTANTTALAANTVPRRGCTVSVVRIMPVEYSEVMVRAPSTAMTSWPTYRPAKALLGRVERGLGDLIRVGRGPGAGQGTDAGADHDQGEQGPVGGAG